MAQATRQEAEVKEEGALVGHPRLRMVVPPVPSLLGIFAPFVVGMTLVRDLLSQPVKPFLELPVPWIGLRMLHTGVYSLGYLASVNRK